MARSAGFNYRAKGNSNHVDFTVVEGIGPKIDELIHAAGIHTYRELSVTNPDDIQTILDAAGPNFKLAKPSTWPAQSGLAASNQWEALKAWQDILDGGEE
jgi:predicted flap endonuclease-1-like 5' DNA nuclease